MVADSAATPGHARISLVVVGTFDKKRRTGAAAFQWLSETIGKRCWVRANGVMAAESETRRHPF